jgi:cation diffusion facilitator CzcD-associated flavoprotein CzcO
MSSEGVQSVLSLLPSSDDLPSTQGDADTVLVVGTGKSAIDNAVLFAKQRRKVLMVGRSFKWMSAPVKPDFIGSEWVWSTTSWVRGPDTGD